MIQFICLYSCVELGFAFYLNRLYFYSYSAPASAEGRKHTDIGGDQVPQS